jgi:carboxypeptidase Q
MFRNWGLKNVRAEGFDFGRGWWIESSSARMVAPRPLALTAIPVAWTPPPAAPSPAPIVVAPIRHVRDLAQYKGKLRGKIVLVSYPDAPKDDTTAHLQAPRRGRTGQAVDLRPAALRSGPVVRPV